MSEFKVGDRVLRARGGNSGVNVQQGGEYTVTRISGKSIEVDGNGGLCHHVENFDLIASSNTTLMTSVKSFIKKVSRKQPERAFVDVGFLDGNEDITEKGREALELVLWDANKEAIKKIADQIIAAEKK